MTLKKGTPVADMSGDEKEGKVIDGELLEAEGEILDAPVEEEAAQPGTALTEAPTTAVSTDVRGNVSAMNELAQEGFEGLELDFSSFTGIVLNGGNFENAGTKQPLRSREFFVKVTRTRSKWAWKSNHDNDKDKVVVYSYDENAANDPDSKVAAAIAEWKKEGKNVGEIKRYLEVWAFMVDCPEDADLNGCLVSMSIPPTSIGRMSGYLFTLKNLKKNLSDVTTRVSTGTKVTNVDFPFTPWDFHYHAG